MRRAWVWLVAFLAGLLAGAALLLGLRKRPSEVVGDANFDEARARELAREQERREAALAERRRAEARKQGTLRWVNERYRRK